LASCKSQEKGEKNLMAKKQITDQELLASQANAEFVNRNTEETVIESEADSLSLEEIKSKAIIHNSNDFDWDMDNKKLGGYSDAERAKLEVLYTTTLSSINKGEIISGTVVSMNTKDVVLNIGFKSDGMVPLSEFRDTPGLKLGDVVEVFVEDQEDKNGQLILSRKRAKTQRSWDNINTALEKDAIINGFVKSRTKGGLIVDIDGVEAFLPGSQIDIKPIRDYDIYVGKTMEFKVVKINQEFRNVVVSHKVLIEDDLESQKFDIISKLEKGQVLEGTVKNITAFGVFIDLGGVDGLLHITDISWGRIEHPEEVLKLDEKINVVVLDFDDEKKRIALGLKQLTPHPWESLDTKIEIGSKVKGKIVTVADYGAFLEIIPGVEGLIHVSEMSWSQHLRSPQEFMKVSDEMEAVILTLDREERKMSLGIKQLTPDPWVGVADRYPVGSKQNAVVKNMTNFGVFVEIEEGIDGLIHISDLSWSKKVNHPHEFTKVGDKLDVVVLEVNAEERKLSLGHKQLEENPWETFETIFTLDSIHQGTIVKVTDKGAVITLPYGVEGFAPTKHLMKDDGKMATNEEVLDFKIIEFNKDAKRIVVSHAKLHEEAKAEARAEETDKKKKEAKAASTAVKKVKDSVEKTTLGDLGVLANLKSSLETSEKGTKAKKDAASAAEAAADVAEDVAE
jgi:small subunit ribosomal protein S1